MPFRLDTTGDVEMDELFDKVTECTRCPLRRTCYQVVAGIGPKSAKLFVLGDAPDEKEHEVGEPFCNLGGSWLNRLMLRGLVDPEKCYYTHLVKCKPPKDEVPHQAIMACKAWLWEELKVVRPKVVLTLGEVTTRLLLKPKSSASLKSVVGQFHDVSFLPDWSCKVIGWYHPTHLLQSGKDLDNQTVKLFRNIKMELDHA